jgi:hypothetical protein
MPKLHHLERLGPHLSIGVQRGNTVKNDETKGVWYARVQMANQTHFQSTGYKYGGGNEELKKLAITRCYEILEEQGKKVAADIPLNARNYVTQLAQKIGRKEEDWGYLHEAEQWMQENERRKANGQEPIYRIRRGRAFWSAANYKEAERDHRLYIQPFLRTIPRRDGLPPVIESLTQRELDRIDDYLISQHPHLGIETRLGIIIELRRFMNWALDKGYIDNVPNIKRPHRGGVSGARKRMRKEITPNDYTRIIDYTRAKYLRVNEQYPFAKTYRHYQYLFHLWILILANTGIRPPTSGTKNTLLRWEHFKIDDADAKHPTLERPDEKGHTYTAVIMPNAVRYIHELRNFYMAMGMNVEEGWVFAHIEDSPKRGGGYRWRVGDPINNAFRKQWVDMGIDLGLIPSEDGINPKKGTPQSERISPSSLRSWFITQRLYSDEKIDIASLARATGTSIGQIEARYFRMDTKRSYEYLTAGGYYDDTRKPIYMEIDGLQYYAGTEK